MVADIPRPVKLLVGEDPSTVQPGDIDLWVSVYSELLQTVTRFLQEPRLSGGDVIRLGTHEQRLSERLSYWQSRAAELSAGFDEADR